MLAIAVDWALLRGIPAVSTCVLKQAARPKPVLAAALPAAEKPVAVTVNTTAIVRAVTGGIDDRRPSNLSHLFDYYGNKTHPLPFPRLDMHPRLR